MKKELIITNIILLIMLLLTGCGNDKQGKIEANDVSNQESENTEFAQENYDDLYFKVLNNEVEYINENNKNTKFSEYMDRYEGTSNPCIKYAIFDFDSDSKNEIIVFIEAYSDGFYLILNNEDNTIYGFEDVYRGMTSIKTDGSYSASGGANLGGVLKCTFEKNKRITQSLAEMDMDKYQIAGEDVTEEEFLSYMEEFNKKENVQFITFIEKYNFNAENENSNNNTENENQSQTETTFKEGIYKMTKPSLVGTDAEGYDTTITFSNGTAQYFESYWRRKKSGTYTVQGDILTIKYTSGNEVNSINGDTGTVKLNETEIYKINENTITMQSTTADSYYKAGSNVYELQ